MRTHKITKSHSAPNIAMTLVDRDLEESLMLKGWATSDSARTMDDQDWDDSLDRFDIASVSEGPGHRYDA